VGGGNPVHYTMAEPALFLGMDFKSIQAPTRNVSREGLEAFRDMLRQLFEEYPRLKILPNGHGEDAQYWRERALTNGGLPPEDLIRLVAYHACDTGVPNERIVAAYTLIFL